MKAQEMIEKLQKAQALLSDVYHEAPSDSVESQMSVADSCIIESIDALKKLKTYRIEASYTTYLWLEVEADSIEKAHDLAREADGGDFKESGFTDWHIDSVTEV
jgi:hypothetical protein